MKHLVETNLESIGNKDFRDLYTDEVKKGMLDYAQGKHNSTPPRRAGLHICKIPRRS